jgi:hypothetical protein
VHLDPDATRVYAFDFAHWLGSSGNTLAGLSALTDSGITATVLSADATSGLMRVSGGQIEAGQEYTDRTVTLRATFADGQIDDWSVVFRVREK